MLSIYKDAIRDALYPKKKGNINKTNKFLKVKELNNLSPSEIKELRVFLQLSQSLFADVLGVSVKTVIAWEKGTNQPCGSALRLMQILKNNPDVIIEAEIMEQKF